MEFRHDLLGKELKTVADILMARLAGLIEQDDLIDMSLLELTQALADRLGRTDQAVAQCFLRLVRLAPILVLAPQVTCARSIDAHATVVGQRKNEKCPAGRFLKRLFISLGTHETVDDCNVWIARVVRQRLGLFE